MAAFSTSNILGGTQVAITATYQTQVMLSAAAADRLLVQEMAVGTVGTPADTYLEYDVSRLAPSAAGTPAAVNSSPLDPASRAALAVAKANYSTEPTTYGASLFYLGLNQRASYRWLAAPGSEIVVSPSTPTGIGLRARGTATTTVSAMMIHIE